MCYFNVLFLLVLGDGCSQLKIYSFNYVKQKYLQILAIVGILIIYSVPSVRIYMAENCFRFYKLVRVISSFEGYDSSGVFLVQ